MTSMQDLYQEFVYLLLQFTFLRIFQAAQW